MAKKDNSAWLDVLHDELSPYPGRISGAMRDALGITLAVVIAMTLRMPGFSLSAALLLLMQRERPGLTLRTGLQILAGCAGAAVMSNVWVQLTDGTETARFLGVALCVFLSAFCMAASTMPLLWTIFGFFGFVDLAYWDGHHTASASVAYSLCHVASLGLVLACATAVEYVFASRHPAEELQQEMRRRVNVLERFFHAMAEEERTLRPQEFRAAHQALLQVEHAGDFRLLELYDRLRSTGSASELPAGLQYRIGVLTRVVHRSVALAYIAPHAAMEAWKSGYQRLALACEQIETGPLAEGPIEPGPLAEIYRELKQYGVVSEAAETMMAKPRIRGDRGWQFFQPGVFQQAGPVLYALKLTLAAMTCYILYNAVAWPGILTCVVTVLFTGLSSTGAMKQKQFYRFSGAVIGGVLGIATVSLLFPNMDSITSLIVVLFPVAMLSGWVMRSPGIGYIGVQIGFAFFLTALQGFGPATQIAPARDRVIGVALGIGVMWLIFDQAWPARTSDALAAVLARIKNATERLQELAKSESSEESVAAELQRLRSVVSFELAGVPQYEAAAKFELGRHRRREIVRTRRLLRDVEATAARFYQQAVVVAAKT